MTSSQRRYHTLNVSTDWLTGIKSETSSRLTRLYRHHSVQFCILLAPICTSYVLKLDFIEEKLDGKTFVVMGVTKVVHLSFAPKVSSAQCDQVK